jgi:hypothetical protein
MINYIYHRDKKMMQVVAVTQSKVVSLQIFAAAVGNNQANSPVIGAAASCCSFSISSERLRSIAQAAAAAAAES